MAWCRGFVLPGAGDGDAGAGDADADDADAGDADEGYLFAPDGPGWPDLGFRCCADDP